MELRNGATRNAPQQSTKWKKGGATDCVVDFVCWLLEDMIATTQNGARPGETTEPHSQWRGADSAAQQR